MGGKKKTKWRKLSLDEFTKEIPIKSEKELPSKTCEASSPKEDIAYIPSNTEQSESTQNYGDPYECVDGIWYPTTCVLYNPAEIGLYSNYMMPPETCYYYYAMPEVPQMQEYLQMPYQECSQALPKDTVYLLLPTQTLRPSQPVQAPEWQSRRRRRRYEGYADYAVIPENQSSTKSEERECYNSSGQQFMNSRRNSSQSNNFKHFSSESSKFNHCNSPSVQNPSNNKPIDLKRKSKMSNDMNNLKENPMSLSKGTEFLSKGSTESDEKSKRSFEICTVHSKGATENKEPKTATKRHPISAGLKNESHSDNGRTTYAEKKNSNGTAKDRNSPTGSDMINDLSNTYGSKTDTKKNFDLLKSRENSEVKSVKYGLKEEDIPETSSQNSLSGILSPITKVTNEKRGSDDSTGSSLLNGVENKEINSKLKHPQNFETSYIPNVHSSDHFHKEMEMELNRVQNLYSSKTNQTFYNLAYNGNSTDESSSRSPTPIDPQSQIPRSIFKSEIIVQEADSDAEPEDAEISFHGLESEPPENRHIFINKLSLAEELILAREFIPFDDEYKRIVPDSDSDNEPGVHTGRRINFGFMGDSFQPRKDTAIKSKSVGPSSSVIDSQYLLKSINTSNDSAIYSDMDMEDLEGMFDTTLISSKTQDNTEGFQENDRNERVQVRRFWQRVSTMNPCCNVM